MEEDLLTLQNLPNEVLCQMIAGLESKNDIRGLLFTNKLFQELVYYSWSKLTLKYDNKLNYHSFLALPADRLHYLLELDISNCDRMTNALFKQILAKTPNLQVLRMKNCKRLTRVALADVVRKLPTLLALDIRGFDLGEAFQLGNILDEQKCPALPLLREFRGSPENVLVLLLRDLLTESITTLIVTGELPTDKIKQFVNLRRLEFSYGLYTKIKTLDLTGKLTNLERLKVGAIDSLILGNRPNLTHLSLVAEPKFNSSFLWPDVKNVKSLHIVLNSDETPFSLKFFPKLEELSTNRCDVKELIDHKIFKKLDLSLTKATDAINVIEANPNLVDVRLPNLQFTEPILTALTKLPRLKRLLVAELRDPPVTDSSSWAKLTALKHLTITPQFRFTKASIFWNSGIKQIPNLEVLILFMNHDIMNTTNQSNWAVFPQQVKEGFKSLKRLVLYGISAPYFEPALTVTSSKQVQHLNYLKVTRNLRTCTNMAFSLSQLCTKLVGDLMCSGQIDVRGRVPTPVLSGLLGYICSKGNLVDEVMQQFLFNGYSSLIIGGCVRLTKKTFLSIPILANEFKTLNFSRCFFLDDEALLQIMIHCKSLQKLHVTDCFGLTDKAFKTVQQDHPSALIGLLDFDFSMCHLMGDDTLFCLGEQATNLTSLGCSKTQITDDSIVNHIAPNCTQLSRLHLDECKAITGASIEALAEHCTNLCELFLANDYLVTDVSLVKLAQRCTNLQTITLSQVNMLQKEPLIAMAKSCKLNYVDISWCGVDSEGLRQIAEFAGSTLETLKIAWCSRIKNDAIQDSMKHLSNLTELDISWKTPTDAIIHEITKHCKNLLVLDLSGCNEISEKAFETLGTCQEIDIQGNIIPKKLQSLSLAWCKNLSDEAIEKIVLGCPNLTSFDASLCSHITNAGIMYLKHLKNLKRLVLSRNNQLTTEAFEFIKECTMVQTLCLPDVDLNDEKFADLVQFLPSLRSLVVSGCSNIGDKTLLALSKYATSLKALAANGCKTISDDGIISLVKNLNYILSLSLAESSITDLGLKAIINSCHSLQALTVSYCPYISDIGVSYVSNCAPMTNFETASCTQLSNLSLREVLRGCEMLKLVNFSSTEIDDELLDDVWMYCKHLTSMEIRGCTKLTNEQIKKCELLSPSLQIKK